jgi:hypothetical protein
VCQFTFHPHEAVLPDFAEAEHLNRRDQATTTRKQYWSKFSNATANDNAQSTSVAASTHKEQAMYHEWRDFTRLSENCPRPPLTADCEPTLGRKGFFATVLTALRESRQLQARHVFRQHRHLIAKEHVIEVAGLNCQYVSGVNLDMTITNNARAQRPSTSLKPWIVVAAVAFCFLHVVGGIMLSAPNARSTETSLIAMRSD